MKGEESREAVTQSGGLLPCGRRDTCSAGWGPPAHTHAGRELVSSARPPSPCFQHPAGRSHTGGSLKHTQIYTHIHTQHISRGIKGAVAHKRHLTLLGLCRRLLLFCSQNLISAYARCLIVSLKKELREHLPKYAYQA